MNQVSEVFIVSLTQDETKNLAELAAGIGHAGAQIITGTISDAIKALETRPQFPDFIIIDIGIRAKDVLPELDEFALHCEPTVNVIIIGSINDITFYRELKQRGILEYFPRPAQASEIRLVMVQASASQRRNQSGGGSVHGTIISCMSAASGDGSSTVAANVSYCLAEELNQSTVLVDMDYQFGLIAKSLDLSAPFGTRELFDHPDRGLDEILVEKMLVKYGNKLNIIASPNELRLMPSISPDIIRSLIEVLRTRFKFVIIDVPHVWTDWTAAAVKNSDHTILVGQLWLRSLTHATRLLAAWQNAGIDRNHISLYINRSGAKFKEAITAEAFEGVCHHKIEAYLNNDIKAVVNAENNGKTIYETAQGSLLQQQMKQIAQSLLSRFHGQSVAESTQGTVGKKGLMGLFDKKSGT